MFPASSSGLGIRPWECVVRSDGQVAQWSSTARAARERRGLSHPPWRIRVIQARWVAGWCPQASSNPPRRHRLWLSVGNGPACTLAAQKGCVAPGSTEGEESGSCSCRPGPGAAHTCVTGTGSEVPRVDVRCGYGRIQHPEVIAAAVRMRGAHSMFPAPLGSRL